MKKSLMALATLSMLGATVAATPALAGDRDRVSRNEIRRDRQNVREERREAKKGLAMMYEARGETRTRAARGAPGHVRHVPRVGGGGIAVSGELDEHIEDVRQHVRGDADAVVLDGQLRPFRRCCRSDLR